MGLTPQIQRPYTWKIRETLRDPSGQKTYARFTTRLARLIAIRDEECEPRTVSHGLAEVHGSSAAPAAPSVIDRAAPAIRVTTNAIADRKKKLRAEAGEDIPIESIGDVECVATRRSALSARAAIVPCMVEIDLEYVGGLRCSATHGPSGATLITDAPLDNHGQGRSFSPTDLVATALGACMMTVMGIVADRHGVKLEGGRVHVVKEMTATPTRRIGALTVEITLPGGGVDAAMRERLEAAAHACPVHHSLHPDIRCDVRFHWTD